MSKAGLKKTISLKEVIAIINKNSKPVSRSHIGRLLGLKGEQRRLLRQALEQEVQSGRLFKVRRGYTYKAPSAVKKTIIKREGETTTIIGAAVLHSGRWQLHAVTRDIKRPLELLPPQAGAFSEGDIIIAEPAHKHRRKQLGFVKRIGSLQDAAIFEQVAIEELGLPAAFSAEAQQQANAAKIPSARDRSDLRDLPLVTIDGEDAKDFDDAVFAAPWPSMPGGWHLVVAIADVAYYVPPQSPLDVEAYDRGTSVYMPNKVLPMLPEALSNGLCSLRPEENRACIAVHMWINEDGELQNYRFERGIMRSHGRLTYTQVQHYLETKQGGISNSQARAVENLYGAFKVLFKARQARNVLELNVPEWRLEFDKRGHVVTAHKRHQQVAHKLIEEFMIAANVAAAKMLNRQNHPTLYRVHDEPDQARLEELRKYLEALGIPLQRQDKDDDIAQLAYILRATAGHTHEQIVHDMILRSQSQALYQPANIGHFGLQLTHYCHFTSPIRRYSDLVVHRGLLHVMGLASPAEEQSFQDMEQKGQHISQLERRAMQAERITTNRYMATLMTPEVGKTFEVQICGVTSFGLFVLDKNTGASGLVPMRALPYDYYTYDAARHCLRGRRGRVLKLGDSVKATLQAANGLTGSMTFRLA